MNFYIVNALQIAGVLCQEYIYKNYEYACRHCVILTRLKIEKCCMFDGLNLAQHINAMVCF